MRRTSVAFINTLKDADIRVLMDGRWNGQPTVFIEQRCRSLKYECFLLDGFETGVRARTGIGRWIGLCNGDRSHWLGRPMRPMLRS